jgi:hypothetical protein
MWVSEWISLLRYNANKHIDKALAVSSNIIMIAIGIHFGLFSVALCLKGDNVCDARTSRCVRIFTYLQWFSIRISKCKKLTDGRRTDGRTTNAVWRTGGFRPPEPPWIRQWLSTNLFLRISTVYSTPRQHK